MITPVWSNLDRLNRPATAKRFAEGGRVDDARLMKPKILLPMPFPRPYGPLWRQMDNPFRRM